MILGRVSKGAGTWAEVEPGVESTKVDSHEPPTEL